MKNKRIKLGDYIEEYSVKNKQGYQYPVYSVTNSNGFCTEYFNKDVSSKDKRNYKIVPYGYFAYNPSRINVGSIDWQHYEKNVIVSPLYVVFKCSNKINQKYLQYFFESEYGKHLINSKVSGSVRTNLKFSSMCEFEFNIGTIEEQQKIISTIDKINKLIDAEKQQLEKLDELIKSKFNEIFGDPITNSKNFKTKLLGDIFKTNSGGTPSSNIKDFYEPPEIPWLNSGDINNNIILNTKKYISKKGLDNSSAKWIPENSILLAMYGATAGKLGLLKFKSTTNQAICSILPNKLFVPLFLFHMLINKTDEILKKCVGGAQQNISQTIIKNITVIIPPIDLQNKFAKFVEKVEGLKNKTQKQIDLYTELLNKKMEEYFN